MKIKKLLFDFDGTLVDSMPAFSQAILRILDENGIKYSDDIIKIITPLGSHATVKYVQSLGLDMDFDTFMGKYYEYVVDRYRYEIPAKKFVIEVLKKLKEHGADLNVLTASSHASLDPCLKRLGIFDLFTNVWSCDDFGTTKADPEIYKLASAKMNAKLDEVLFLDDNLGADTTAKKAGMKVCGVFDPFSSEYVKEMKQVCDYYINDFSELIDIVL